MQPAGLAALDNNDCFNQALQGIFPTQGLNPHLWSLTALAGGFFTTSTTWEAPHDPVPKGKFLSAWDGVLEFSDRTPTSWKQLVWEELTSFKIE